MHDPLTHLGVMPIAEFIRDYWQQKPLLIRNAFPGFTSPISPDELAGLALEEDIESRLVIEKPHKTNPLASAWSLEHGPLPDTIFSQLPPTHWTLLIQAVDQIFPEIHALLHKFRFVPNWRLDDVMVSYAVAGGGVGPHFDYYDVFLLQGQGRRLWRLGGTVNAETPLRDDTDMKLLTEFSTTEDWVLEPGDMLYIPPNLAHWGVALEECITYSIGFRAPSHSELLLEFAQDIGEGLSPDDRYTDPNFTLQANPGLIDQAAINRVTDTLTALLSDRDRLADWFGRYMTDPKRNAPEVEHQPAGICLSAQSRAAYIPTADGALLFINGQSAECSLALAEDICAYRQIDPARYELSDRELISEAIAEGWLDEGSHP